MCLIEFTSVYRKVFMARVSRSKTELIEASVHLHYELEMLRLLAHEQGTQPHHPVLNNALLECIAIHARVLFDFFYNDSPRSDDVSAIDYLPDWPKIRPATSAHLLRIGERVGKEVAHLTYARLDVLPELKGWDVVGLANEIRELMKSFVKLVPANLLSKKWEYLIVES